MVASVPEVAPEPPPATPAAAPAKMATASAAPAIAPAPKEKSVSVPFSKDDFKNDPLIQKALEIFKGKIAEVRS
jgi:hypothetical protein